MKDTVLLLIGPGDVTGTHFTSCLHFSSEFRNRGFKTEIITVRTKKSLRVLYERLSKGDIYCVHVEQGQLLGVHLNNKQNIFDYFDVPVCSQIRDHWFYPWLFPHLLNMPEKSILVHCDTTSEGITKHLKGVHMQGSTTAQYARGFLPKELRKESKPVFVGTIRDPEKIQSMTIEKYPKSRALIEILLDSLSFSAKIPEWFWEINYENDFVFFNKFQDPVERELYFDLFTLARFTVRSSFANTLSQLDCRIYGKGDWNPPKKYKAEIDLSGVTKLSAQNLAADATIILSDQAGLRNGLGERVAAGVLDSKPILMRDSSFSRAYINQISGLMSFSNHEEIPGKLQEIVTTEVNNSDAIDKNRTVIPREILPISYVDQALEHIRDYS